MQTARQNPSGSLALLPREANQTNPLRSRHAENNREVGVNCRKRYGRKESRPIINDRVDDLVAARGAGAAGAAVAWEGRPVSDCIATETTDQPRYDGPTTRGVWRAVVGRERTLGK